jgi:hypothetical protein
MTVLQKPVLDIFIANRSLSYLIKLPDWNRIANWSVRSEKPVYIFRV